MLRKFVADQFVGAVIERTATPSLVQRIIDGSGKETSSTAAGS
ncbi:hypothetical protein ACWDKQ_01195 [Saccharopolyspora sp. NPDC000995]